MPLAAARARGEIMKLELAKRAGGLLTPAELEVAGVSSAAIATAPLTWEGRLPACQFVDDQLLEGLTETVAALSVSGFWTRLSFLLAQDVTLKQTPIEALRAGRLKAVLATTHGFG